MWKEMLLTTSIITVRRKTPVECNTRTHNGQVGSTQRRNRRRATLGRTRCRHFCRLGSQNPLLPSSAKWKIVLDISTQAQTWKILYKLLREQNIWLNGLSEVFHQDCKPPSLLAVKGWADAYLSLSNLFMQGMSGKDSFASHRNGCSYFIAGLSRQPQITTNCWQSLVCNRKQFFEAWCWQEVGANHTQSRQFLFKLTGLCKKITNLTL